MCQWGDSVEVSDLLAHGIDGFHRRTWGIDRCIAPLVVALNQGGIDTIASCCGHGKGPGLISLLDGRSITITDTEGRNMDRNDVIITTNPHLLDLEAAWSIIANVSQGDWTRQTKEWQEAATWWRDEVWHKRLAENKSVGVSVSDLNPEAIERWAREPHWSAAHRDLARVATEYASLLRRVQLGEVVLVEKVDGEWRAESDFDRIILERDVPCKHGVVRDQHYLGAGFLNICVPGTEVHVIRCDSLAASRGETP